MNKIELNGGPYAAKDQVKSDRANKFIGRGSLRSSTHKYMLSWDSLANCGNYKKDDIVFISAEGGRAGRIDPNFEEIFLAIRAGATLITDDKENRSRAYNVGERDIEKYLIHNKYIEIEPGVWKPSP